MLCILLLIRDKYLPSVVLMCGCIILVALGQCTVQEAFIGFCNEITFIVLGTEIYGVALVESGTLEIFCDKLIRYADKDRKKIVFLCGFAVAVLSAFLNNQVVCSIMLVLCISLAQKCKEISVLDITLPIILCAVIGGQCTLIGAPATTDEYMCGFAPYGYLKSKTEKNRIVVDEATAGNVRLIYKLFLEGKGYTSIAKYLNEQGIMSPLMYLKSLGYQQNVKTNGVWTKTTVKSILTNQAYIGSAVHGKVVIEKYNNIPLHATDPSEWVIVENTHS